MRGVVLPLYAADPTFDYGFAMKEIADLNANAVNLLLVLMQDNAESLEMGAVEGRTTPDDRVRTTIRQAREAGLEVMILPIVLLQNPEGDDWRGNLRPDPAEDWFRTYKQRILHYARMAEEEGVAWLSVGSEFSSLESETASWRDLIASVRGEFSGSLIYSCNWDHYDGPDAWWGDLDAVGLSSYYELTNTPDATQNALDTAWIRWREQILAWHRNNVPELPIIFTEIGYPSMDGAAMYPWDYTLEGSQDVTEQAMAYRAFISAWHDRPEAGGFFFFKWLSFDADDALSYSPRGKPAAELVRAWYGVLSRREQQTGASSTSSLLREDDEAGVSD